MTLHLLPLQTLCQGSGCHAWCCQPWPRAPEASPGQRNLPTAKPVPALHKYRRCSHCDRCYCYHCCCYYFTASGPPALPCPVWAALRGGTGNPTGQPSGLGRARWSFTLKLLTSCVALRKILPLPGHLFLPVQHSSLNILPAGTYLRGSPPEQPEAQWGSDTAVGHGRRSRERPTKSGSAPFTKGRSIPLKAREGALLYPHLDREHKVRSGTGNSDVPGVSQSQW